MTRTKMPLNRTAIHAVRIRCGLAVVLAVCGTGLANWAPLAAQDAAAGGKPAVPAGLPELEVPQDNPLTAAKIELGKQLYFDARLSIDQTVSCATCHDPAKGWSNGEQFATGVKGQVGGRNSPTVINTAFQVFQFWDGRAKSLEEQALGPIENPIEMALPLAEMEERLNKIDGYRRQFKQVFGKDRIEAADVARAIASFERTVLSGNSAFEKYHAGDTKALSAGAVRGMQLFFGKARCSSCHNGPNFTDNAFHNIGIGMDKPEPDVGRAAISKLEGDTGAFKTPTLREITRTAPYMHDGSLKTLEEVIEHYNKGGIENAYLDEEIFPLKLTETEKADLLAFLKEALHSPTYPLVKPPKLPE